MQPQDGDLTIRLVDSQGDALKISDVLVDLQLFVNGNWRYWFVAGKTADNGELRVSYVDIEAQRSANARLFLMDFNTKLEECDRRIRIVVPSETELRDQVRRAVEAFGREPLWAKQWPANQQIKPAEIDAEWPPGGATVDVVSDKA